MTQTNKGGAFSNNTNITNYYLSNTDDIDFGIINEIFKYILSINRQIPEYNPEPDFSLINVSEKIKINFKNPEEELYVYELYTNSLLYIGLVKRAFEGLNRFEQDSITTQIKLKYLLNKKDAKKEGWSSYNILLNIIEYYIPPSKDGKYFTMAQAIVLFFFDDCTIFEKTDSEKEKWKAKSLF